MLKAAEERGGKTLGNAPRLRGIVTGPTSHTGLENPNLLLFHSENHLFPFSLYTSFSISFLFFLVSLHLLFSLPLSTLPICSEKQLHLLL